MATDFIQIVKGRIYTATARVGKVWDDPPTLSGIPRWTIGLKFEPPYTDYPSNWIAAHTFNAWLASLAKQKHDEVVRAKWVETAYGAKLLQLLDVEQAVSA